MSNSMYRLMMRWMNAKIYPVLVTWPTHTTTLYRAVYPRPCNTKLHGHDWCYM